MWVILIYSKVHNKKVTLIKPINCNFIKMACYSISICYGELMWEKMKAIVSAFYNSKNMKIVEIKSSAKHLYALYLMSSQFS